LKKEYQNPQLTGQQNLKLLKTTSSSSSSSFSFSSSSSYSSTTLGAEFWPSQPLPSFSYPGQGSANSALLTSVYVF
jgi:hypothetical protein